MASHGKVSGRWGARHLLHSIFGLLMEDDLITRRRVVNWCCMCQGGTGGDQSCTLSCIVSCQGIFVLILACFGVSSVLQENMGRCFMEE